MQEMCKIIQTQKYPSATPEILQELSFTAQLKKTIVILSIPGAHGSPEATGVVGGSHLPNSDTLQLAGFSTVKKILK